MNKMNKTIKYMKIKIIINLNKIMNKSMKSNHFMIKMMIRKIFMKIIK